MNGREAIIAKIIDDARKIANTTSEEASAKAKETLSIARNDADIYLKENMEASYKEREDIIKRRLSSAEIEARKMVLQTKQDILTEVFDIALSTIKSDEKNYKKLIEKMVECGVVGDVVIVSKSDKELLTSEFIKKAGEKAKKKISLSKTYGDFAGGIILQGDKTDKNMTLEVELATIRDNFEPEIVEKLFK
jgi:V/A-type H+-transporting ATPase subunit E